MAEKIYVLKLAEGKYYVGKSADVAQRFKQHMMLLEPLSNVQTCPRSTSPPPA